MSSKVIRPGGMPPWLYSPAPFGTFIHQYFHGEARVIWLRLPSYGFGYDVNCDEERWGQRVLIYHGHRGFRIAWRFHL